MPKHAFLGDFWKTSALFFERMPEIERKRERERQDMRSQDVVR